METPARSKPAFIALAPKDPIEAELDKMVDDVCRTSCRLSQAYRQMQCGNSALASKQMTQIIRDLASLSGRAHVVLWECSKRRAAAPRGGLRTKRIHPSVPLLARTG